MVSHVNMYKLYDYEIKLIAIYSVCNLVRLKYLKKYSAILTYRRLICERKIERPMDIWTEPCFPRPAVGCPKSTYNFDFLEVKPYHYFYERNLVLLDCKENESENTMAISQSKEQMS